MLSKELFVKTLESIKKHRERETKFIEGLDALSPGTYNDTLLYSSYESLVVELLQEAMDDKDEIISFFIYEMDFGKENPKISLLLNEQPIWLPDSEALYNFLTKEKK